MFNVRFGRSLSWFNTAFHPNKTTAKWCHNIYFNNTHNACFISWLQGCMFVGDFFFHFRSENWLCFLLILKYIWIFRNFFHFRFLKNVTSCQRKVQFDIYIANSSWNWGSYGSIWIGPSPKKYYMDRSFWGPYNLFLVTDRSIYCHMTRSDMNYLPYYTFYLK